MGHDHSGHDHAGHSHSADAQAFYMDQLCTIALCGGLAVVGILMWIPTTDPETGKARNLLSYILADQFHLPVLAGSIAILVLVAIRAVVLWRSVDKAAAHQHHHDHDHDHHHDHAHGEGECCGHDHDHHHDHDHDHNHKHDHDHNHDHDHAHSHEHEEACCGHGHSHGHGHDHDHEHGWQPWRYMVLLLPIALYLLDLPNRGFSQDYLLHRLPELENAHLINQDAALTAAATVGSLGVVADGPWLALVNLAARANADDKPYFIEFGELKQAAYVPQLRAALDGKTVKLLGQFVRGGTDFTCSLVRIKMQCCAADAQPLNVVIISPEKLTNIKPMTWVEIEGTVQFRKRKDKNEYLPVLQIKGKEKIKPAEAPKQLYL